MTLSAEFMENDPIRDVITARAETLGLTAYAIAKRCDMSPEAVKRYLTGRCSLNSRYVSAICEVLGLELRPIKNQKVKRWKNILGR